MLAPVLEFRQNVDLICAVACSRHASGSRECCLPNSPWGGSQMCIAVEAFWNTGGTKRAPVGDWKDL